MPPFASGVAKRSQSSAVAGVVSINVGGQLFRTSPQTLALAGPDSLLSSLSNSNRDPDSDPNSPSVPFIDRDPDRFAALLSLLRTGRLPSAAAGGDLDDLLDEACFYGVELLVLASLSDPSLFDGFGLRRAIALPLSGRDPPSALAVAGSSGAVLVAHGGKVTAFDPALRRRATILTPFPAVDSLLALSPSLAAAGAVDFPGLHLLDPRRSCRPITQVLHWSLHPSAGGGGGDTVQAIGSSPDLLFGSFESGRRNASAIVAFDLNSLQPVAEIGHREIFGAELDSGIPATKLGWVSGFNLLMASGSHGGPSGLLGNIRLWDVRSGEAVWDLKERVDCFADVTASDGLSAVFKVGVDSGEVFMADLRKLGGEEPWVCLGNGRKAGAGRREGSGSRIESYGRQVFCSRGGDVEMWTQVVVKPPSTEGSEDGSAEESVMRRNLMGSAKDVGGKKITMLGFGGSRMVVARKDEQSVEVWESSVRS